MLSWQAFLLEYEGCLPALVDWGTGCGIYVGNYEDTACTDLDTGNFALVLRTAETSIGGVLPYRYSSRDSHGLKSLKEVS